MGYATRYNLEVHSGDLTIKQILDDVLYEHEDLSWAIDENGESNDFCKWYDHEKDMREISKKYPDIVFKLHGEGEENGDIWNKYFKNGQMQECYAKIVFDEFDESKLK